MVIVLREIHTVSLRRIFSWSGRYEMAKPALSGHRYVGAKKEGYWEKGKSNNNKHEVSREKNVVCSLGENRP